MAPPTIDRKDVIDLFHQLMQTPPEPRVLRLLGEAKMGKSHLLTKVFPALIRQHYPQTRCAVLDLRRSDLGIADILQQLCTLLGGESTFPAYTAAHADWLNRPTVQARNLTALFSAISIRATESSRDERATERHLTAKFITDLHRLAPTPLIFLFDALEQSHSTIQNWLMDELLVSLTPLEHVRVVVAGRTIPDAAGSYAACCASYELRAVEDTAAYISYCQQLKLDIQEQFITEFARVFDYKPGFFAEIVSRKYPRRGELHG